MSFEFQTYSIQKVGKIIKDSKKRHMWKFKLDQEYFEVKALESRISGKFRVMVQDSIVLTTKMNDEFKRKGVSVQAFGLELKFVKGNDKFDLYINDTKFIPQVKRTSILSKGIVSAKADNLPKDSRAKLSMMDPYADQNYEDEPGEQTYQMFKADFDQSSDDDDFGNFEKTKKSDPSENLDKFKSPVSRSGFNTTPTIPTVTNIKTNSLNSQQDPFKNSPFGFNQPKNDIEPFKSPQQNFTKFVKPVSDDDDFLSFDFGPKTTNPVKPSMPLAGPKTSIQGNQGKTSNAFPDPFKSSSNSNTNSVTISEPSKFQVNQNKVNQKGTANLNNFNFETTSPSPPQKQSNVVPISQDPFSVFDNAIKPPSNQFVSPNPYANPIEGSTQRSSLTGNVQRSSLGVNAQRTNLNASTNLNDSKVKFKNFDFGSSLGQNQPPKATLQNVQNPSVQSNITKPNPIIVAKETGQTIKKWPAFPSQNDFVPNNNLIFENPFPELNNWSKPAPVNQKHPQAPQNAFDKFNLSQTGLANDVIQGQELPQSQTQKGFADPFAQQQLPNLQSAFQDFNISHLPNERAYHQPEPQVIQSQTYRSPATISTPNNLVYNANTISQPVDSHEDHGEMYPNPFPEASPYNFDLKSEHQSHGPSTHSNNHHEQNFATTDHNSDNHNIHYDQQAYDNTNQYYNQNAQSYYDQNNGQEYHQQDYTTDQNYQDYNQAQDPYYTPYDDHQHQFDNYGQGHQQGNNDYSTYDNNHHPESVNYDENTNYQAHYQNQYENSNSQYY